MRGVTPNDLAYRVALDIHNGACVNLGIGMPTLVANHIGPDKEVIFHSENGILGVGPKPADADIDLDLVNVSSEPVTLVPGGCFISHVDSFALVRGGHLDIAVLGAYQVSATGDLANWLTTDPNAIPGVGGAMDIALGAKQVFVMMNHTTKTGEPKIVNQCTYPLTARAVVKRIYTNYCVIAVTPDGLLLKEIAPGVTVEWLQSVTAAPLKTSDDLKEMPLISAS